MTQIDLPLLHSGKVRDCYGVGHDRMLLVASDRISAFDVVLDDPIPQKGHVLTGLSAHWFEVTRDLVSNHLISADPTDFPEIAGANVAGRAMLVRRAQPVKMECVVRGYLFGSAWKEYQASGTINGHPIPGDLHQAERLAEPIFTPTTKADAGHDMALTDEEAVALVGKERFELLRRLSIALYERAVERAGNQGLMLADTKLEFGDVDGEIVLIDELFTPDSSRFWLADQYEVGTSPPSFDKQFVRDHLEAMGWNHDPPAPRLPAEVIAGTRARYVEAYELLTGLSFNEWFGVQES